MFRSHCSSMKGTSSTCFFKPSKTWDNSSSCFHALSSFFPSSAKCFSPLEFVLTPKKMSILHMADHMLQILKWPTNPSYPRCFFLKMKDGLKQCTTIIMRVDTGQYFSLPLSLSLSTWCSQGFLWPFFCVISEEILKRLLKRRKKMNQLEKYQFSKWSNTINRTNKKSVKICKKELNMDHKMAIDPHQMNVTNQASLNLHQSDKTQKCFGS